MHIRERQARDIGTALIAGALLLGAGHAGAATIAADAETLAATTQLAARLPAPQSFTVTAAGQVQVTLTDLVAPQAFTQLQLVVSSGGSKVASLDSAGSQQFAATPGSYRIQVVGLPAAATSTAGPAGTFQVEVRELAGNTVLKQFTDGVAALPAPPTAQSGLDTTVAFTQAGTYQVTLTDRSLPAALSSLSLLLNPAGGGLPVTMSGPCVTACTQSFTVSTAGNYDLFVVATGANPDLAGLYSLKISGGPAGAVVYATTQPVGLLAAATNITLPAVGAYTLSSADFATPVALSALKLRLMQGADQLAALDASGSSIVSGAALAGSAQLFAFARAASGSGGGAGVYAVGLTQGAQAVYRDVRTLPSGYDATVNAGGYPYAFTVAASGNYRLQVRDLNFPTAFSLLRAVVVQNGNMVQSGSGASIDASFPLAAGPAFLAVVGSPSASSANSLMGISLAPQAGGTTLLNQAQGIGPLFATHTVTVPAAGSYDLSINDLHFPATFGELAVAVTSGPDLVGQIFGSGQIRFTAQPGTYSINLLARADATAQYGTWGYELADTPPAPAVNLSVSPAAVSPNGTAMITWSTTNATSCSATGGWNGTRPVSGTETSAALAGDTTFTLSCTGTGGSSSRSATVTVTASNTGSGGGGALGAPGLLLLAGMASALRRARTRRNDQARFGK